MVQYIFVRKKKEAMEVGKDSNEKSGESQKRAIFFYLTGHSTLFLLLLLLLFSLLTCNFHFSKSLFALQISSSHCEQVFFAKVFLGFF